MAEHEHVVTDEGTGYCPLSERQDQLLREVRVVLQAVAWPRGTKALLAAQTRAVRAMKKIDRALVR